MDPLPLVRKNVGHFRHGNVIAKIAGTHVDRDVTI